MPPRRQPSGNGSEKAIKSLDILHEGWVLKKKRKKIQGMLQRGWEEEYGDRMSLIRPQCFSFWNQAMRSVTLSSRVKGT